MTGDSASHVWYQVEDGLSECRWLSADDDHGEVASQTDRDLFFRLDARRLKRGEYIAAVHLLSGGRPSFDIVIMVYLTVADPLSRPPLSAATTPESCRLQSIYPNPFNCETTICYRIENDSRVSMAVYDLQGRLVKRLLDGQQPGGERRLSWRPADLPAGEYVLRLQSGRGSDVKKLVHLP